MQTIVPDWYFERLKSGAREREIPFEVKRVQLCDIMREQGGLCKLTGAEIGFDAMATRGHTASADRIDNDLGYTVQNLMFVHKVVNMMRGALSVENFVAICSRVVITTGASPAPLDMNVIRIFGNQHLKGGRLWAKKFYARRDDIADRARHARRAVAAELAAKAKAAKN